MSRPTLSFIAEFCFCAAMISIGIGITCWHYGNNIGGFWFLLAAAPLIYAYAVIGNYADEQNDGLDIDWDFNFYVPSDAPRDSTKKEK